ncbi:hypothetical protein LIER_40469 [Lithospermum erythrorhizon]|uniref:Integrase catalytic domain-containing protein n=1 Tax=Lithospermum erythrorhizon TaxID=34254 RepID=A0AAV3QV93_LITER
MIAYVMKEVHAGCCGNHVAARLLLQKIIRQGYYWPSMRKECIEFERRCDSCQRYSNKSNASSTNFIPLVRPLPFAQWGIDLLGPFPTAPGNMKSCIVAIDYFTKCIEAKALTTTKQTDVESYIWKQVICRFGVPLHIVTDHDKQFQGNQITAFFERLGIHHHTTLVSYPQANGQIENMNQSIIHGIRTRVGPRIYLESCGASEEHPTLPLEKPHSASVVVRKQLYLLRLDFQVGGCRLTTLWLMTKVYE